MQYNSYASFRCYGVVMAFFVIPNTLYFRRITHFHDIHGILFFSIADQMRLNAVLF